MPIGFPERALSLGYAGLLAAACAITLVACWREARRTGGRGWAIAALFGLAFVARLAAAAATGKVAQPDTYEYEIMAANALAGHGFEYRLLGTPYHPYGTPLYPLVNTAAYDVAGRSMTALFLFGAAVASATAPVAHRLAARLWGPRLALAAGILVALHPPLLVYAGKLHPLGIEAFCAVAAVLWASRWIERGRWLDALGAGAVIALGGLSRPTFLSLLAAAVVMAALRLPRPVALRTSVAAALVSLTVLAPWTLYVSQLYGRPVFMNVSGGVVFWYGNNPNASGSAYAPSGEVILSLAPPDLIARVTDTDESTADAAFVRAAAEHIRSDPLAFIRRTALKLLYFWTIPPSAGLLYPAAWRALYLVYYAFVVALAALGILTWLRGGRAGSATVVLGAALAILVSVAQSLYYVDGRHRWEIEALLLVLVPGGAAMLMRRVARLRPGAGAASAARGR